MIDEIDKEIKKIEVAVEMLPKIVNDAVRNNAAEVIRMNVEQHLKGQTAEGKAIGKYASSTKKQRQRKGLQVAFVDLEQTKNYHSSFAISYLEDRIELNAPDVPYSIFLDNRYKDLFGLTKENLSRLSKLIEEECTTRLNKLL